MRAKAKTHPGRTPRKKDRKSGKAKDKGKSGKSKKGKPFKG